MARAEVEKIRDVCGALRFEKVDVPEIRRRLAQDLAGIGHPVDLSERRIYEHVRAYEEIHGPPPEPDAETIEQDTAERLKRRIVALIAREVGHLERKRKGRLTAKDSAVLRAHYRALDEIERRRHVGKLPGATKPRGAGHKPPSEGKPPGALEQLLEQEKGPPVDGPSPASNGLVAQGATS